MCIPAAAMPILTMAMSVASGVVGYMAQSQQADYQNKMAEVQAKNARTAANSQYKALALRDQQTATQTGQKMEIKSKEAAQAMSTAAVAAGESGVSGLSVTALLSDYARQQGNANTIYRYNRDAQLQQSVYDRKGIQSQGQSRINEAAARMLPEPSFIGHALKIGGDIMSIGDKAGYWG
jgi:Mg/Co/Ni transporter MgtE